MRTPSSLLALIITLGASACASNPPPCGEGELWCDGVCSRCPSPAETLTCAESRCVAATCAPGFRMCATGCCFFTTDEVVDRDGAAGAYSALLVSSLGAVHIAYIDPVEEELRYAFRPKDGEWSISTVAASGAQRLALARSSSGASHICFTSDSGSLQYAHRAEDTAPFAVETIDPNEKSAYCSLALDDSGDPHVSYYLFGEQDLRYARLHPTQLTWATETVDAPGEVGRDSAIDFDQAGWAHIAYTDDSDTRLKHAMRDPASGVWTTEVVDQEGAIATHATLALGPDGERVIAYSNEGGATGDPERQATHLATFTEDAWRFERNVVAGSGPYRMRIGPDGRIHLLHLLGSGLVYSVREDGQWQSHAVAPVTYNLARDRFSLALDAEGRPHVTWFDEEDGALHYLR